MSSAVSLPYFLEHPESILNLIDFRPEDSLLYLLRAISTLYCEGYKYDELLDGAVKMKLEAARSIIIKKYELSSYPYIRNLVNYVYTRDEAINPFGPWLEIPFFLPLAIYDMVKQDFGDTADSKIIMKLSGLVFALYKLYPIMRQVSDEEISERVQNLENKREKYQLKTLEDLSKIIFKEVYLEQITVTDKFQLILKPATLYRIANISQASFLKYMRKFIIVKYGLSFQYDVKKNQRHYQQLYLDNVESLITEIEKFIETNKKQYSVLSEKVLDIEKSGLNISDFHKMDKATEMYESKFSRDRSGYFNNSGLTGNPFLRISRKDSQIFIFSQLNLTNYKVLFYSLYANISVKSSRLKLEGGDQYFDTKFIKRLSNIKLSDFKSEIKELFGICDQAGLLIKKHPIDSPDHSKTQSRHFQQIEDCKKIIQRIRDCGIPISQQKVDELLKVYAEGSLDPNESLIDIVDDISVSEPGEVIDSSEQNSFGHTSKYSWLKKIKASSNQIGKKPDRIYGYFTANGASTHRMTCRDLNLQGIPRIIRENIFSSREGYSLISLDVSGQDLVVAANLASKMYIDPRMKDIIGSEKLSILLVQIKLTLQSLQTAPKSKPVDYIISRLEELHLELFSCNPEEEVRGIVKKIIYIHFYGGGMNALLNSMSSEKEIILHPSLKEKLLALFNLDNIPTDLKILIDTIINNNTLTVVNINDFVDQLKLFTEVSEIIELVLRDLMLILENFNKDIEHIEELFDIIVEMIGFEYPGILESLPYYRSFVESKSNLNSLTYPTFLGWQTVIDEFYQTRSDYLATRSQSYPIQASGAEFIRQWLIEVSKLPGYQTQFFICNVIHDQIVIEVKNSSLDRVCVNIIKASKDAAGKIGMIPGTIQLKVEKLA